MPNNLDHGGGGTGRGLGLIVAGQHVRDVCHQHARLVNVNIGQVPSGAAERFLVVVGPGSARAR